MSNCVCCNAPATGNPAVCSRCRPAFDWGRRAGLTYAIQIIGDRLKSTHDDFAPLTAALRGAMPSKGKR